MPDKFFFLKYPFYFPSNKRRRNKIWKMTYLEKKSSQGHHISKMILYYDIIHE
jgi:hypothetical protein